MRSLLLCSLSLSSVGCIHVTAVPSVQGKAFVVKRRHLAVRSGTVMQPRANRPVTRSKRSRPRPNKGAPKMRNIAILFAFGLFVVAVGLRQHWFSDGRQHLDDRRGWYVKTTGMGGLIFSSKVFYCPQPNTAGPAQCKEAKMVEGK